VQPIVFTCCAGAVHLPCNFHYLQVHRVTGPSRLDEQSVSLSGHNNINLSPLQTKLMPPPPPKSMPPPIRKALPKSPTEKEGEFQNSSLEYDSAASLHCFSWDSVLLFSKREQS
jgi:hypothetical protein